MTSPDRGRITIGSTIIAYTIVRSARRKKTMEVQVVGRRSVKVAAPVDAQRDRVEQLLRTRSRWLVARVSKTSQPAARHEFVSGETFLYLGRQARLRIREVKAQEEPSVRLVRGRLEVRIRPTKSTSTRRARVQVALERWYRERAESKLIERVALYASQFGVRPKDIIVRDQSTRWASCNKHGVLRFNWRIISAPVALVDYVVVHELSHLAGNREHADHFWRTLARVLPDFEARREILRSRGHEFAA